jgi:hypothetical protein
MEQTAHGVREDNVGRVVFALASEQICADPQGS